MDPEGEKTDAEEILSEFQKTHGILPEGNGDITIASQRSGREN